MRGLLPDLQRGSPVSQGAALRTQLLRELPAGPLSTPGSRHAHRLPAVPTPDVYLRGGEAGPRRAEGGRVHPGAAHSLGSPRPTGGGRGGERRGGGQSRSRRQ